MQYFYECIQKSRVKGREYMSRVKGKVEGPKMSLKVREKPRVIRVIIYFLFLK